MKSALPSKNFGLERRLQIGSGEIATLEKQRFAPDFCQSIAGAIDDIQLSRMASPLSISPESLKSCLGHFWIERHNNDTGMIKHLVKIHGPPCRRGGTATLSWSPAL
jgi:hypothetical protein